MSHMKKEAVDYAANYLRGLVYWLNARPEFLNDGLTVETLMKEYNHELNNL
jgi:hypothetical protein